MPKQCRHKVVLEVVFNEPVTERQARQGLELALDRAFLSNQPRPLRSRGTRPWAAGKNVLRIGAVKQFSHVLSYAKRNS